jgi:hypothetical protein
MAKPRLANSCVAPETTPGACLKALLLTTLEIYLTNSLDNSCSQCIRAGRVFNGYINPSDFMFWDESRCIHEKARRQSAIRADSAMNTQREGTGSLDLLQD